MENLKIEDFGYFTLEIAGATVRLDARKTRSEMAAMYDKHKDDRGAYYAALNDYIKNLGFPDCSYTMIDLFADTVVQVDNDLKKKADACSAANAAWLAGTASTPGN